MRRTLLLAALLLAPLAALRAAEPPKPAGKPNIVFILFDDMGYGEPPCFRADSGFKTPNLDRLARQGMRFTDAHTAASVCTPTRYGLMTGRYPCRIGQYGVLDHFSPPIIEKQRTTVASLLRSQGYNTACLGKWHLGMNFVRHGKDKEAAVGTPVADGPATRGFDIFCGYTEARSIGTIIGNDRIVAHDEPVEVQPMLAKKAEAYLEQRRPGQPFFLYVPLCVPHVPIVPSEEFTGKSRSGPYGDWILEGDAVVGQIMAALDRGKLAENTLLLVSSDNGAAKRVYAPLRGCKTSIYEGGHRVPFLARWPGKIKPGAVCDDTICLNDLLATCAEVVGAKLPDNAGEDSVSILPDLLRTAHHPVREATVHQSPAGELAIRQGPWKLIFFKGSRRELYNLQDDLSETRDQLAAKPEIVQHLTKLMEQYIANGRSTPGAVQKNDADISLDGKQGKAKGRGKAKQKQRARSKQEVNLAMDPDFD